MQTLSTSSIPVEQTSSPTPHVSEAAILDSVIAVVTRSRRMRREDAEDFRQTVYLRVVQRNGDIFWRFSGRSSLRTYLAVVVTRMLLDWRNHTLGKWRPSAAARRLGAVAESLDRLMHRDRLPADEAIAHLCSRHPELEPAELRRLIAMLPARRHRSARLTELEQVVGFIDPVEERQRRSQVRGQLLALARALATLDRDDRRLIWLRYRRRLTVTSIAKALGTDSKCLYRRFDGILRVLHRELRARGITAPVMNDRR